MEKIPSIVTINPQDLHARDGYRLLSSLVVPRPIAWVSSLGADGTANLAPFSFFNAVAGSPPTIMFSVGRRQGAAKDTLRNIQETGEFVIHLAGQELSQALNISAANVDYDVDEFELAGLDKAASVMVRAPRVAQAPVAMEARATQFVPVEGSIYTVVFGQIVYYHIREDLLTAEGLVDATRLDPLLRLGGSQYASLGAIFDMPRPE
jgi:flavin reductase (DIM6/NTAB) family NADH-FMN oxidoreductase RutF